jgi:hypothetical protein
VPSSQRSRLRLLLKLPFDLREEVFTHLFCDSHIAIARDHFESSSKRQEIVLYPLSITLLSTCCELRKLRPQALRNVFQIAPLVLMGTSPPTQLPELLPQGQLAKVKYLILDSPLEGREVPSLRICPKDLPALETLHVYNLKRDTNWFSYGRYYEPYHPHLWKRSCSSAPDDLLELSDEYITFYALQTCRELLGPLRGDLALTAGVLSKEQVLQATRRESTISGYHRTELQYFVAYAIPPF